MTDIALVSRSVAPFGGGGIGEYVAALSRTLTQLGRVTVFTTSGHEPAYRRLRERGGAGALAPDVEYAFVEEAELADGYVTALHQYTARVLDAIAERYPDGGPDLIEVPDYLAEGFVLAQAIATGDRRVARSRLVVRIHTSAEICAVLNGHYDDRDFATRATAEMERYTLRHAHAVLWAGGDILGLYRRFYGADGLAQAVQVRHPLRMPAGAPARAAGDGDPLKLLYLGRLERRKGVQNLARALTALPGPQWQLTLLGGDTETAPLGGSMRGELELIAAGDERFQFHDELPREQLPALVGDHDLLVMPSTWECWPYVALEALSLDVPILSAPVGGLTEIVRPGVTGWHARDPSASALADALEPLTFEADRTRELAGGQRAAVAALTNEDEIVSSYERLIQARPATRRRSDSPLVSIVVPYWRMAGFVEDTLRSIAEQTYRPIETLVIHDGSFDPSDRVLEELSVRYPVTVLSQANAGLGAARNFGVRQARGRYVLPLDSDNMIEPSFVERCVELLEGDPALAYVTAWSRYVDELGRPLDQDEQGFQPFGNEGSLVEVNNVAGDAAAVIRRRLFDLGFDYSEDLTSYEDWELYIRLHRAGHRGAVIPERLLRYRIREDSMIRDIGLPRTDRLVGEMRAHLRQREIEWAPRNG